MTVRRIAGGVLLLGLAGAAGAADLARHRVHTHDVCGLPPYDYRGSATTSVTASAISMAALVEQPRPEPLPTTPLGAAQTRLSDAFRVRYFQLERAQLAVEHCSLSRVAIALFEDGTYTVAFQADQNPRLSGDPADAIKQRPDVVRQTTQLRRNEFHVRVRFYGAFAVSETSKVTTGKPVLVEWPLCPFWVQRGEPYPFFLRGDDPDVRRHFDRIDRAEVEFFFR